MKRKALFLLILPLALAWQARAQSASYSVRVTPVKPTPSCSFSSSSYTVNLGNVTIPWSGTNYKTGYGTITINYTNATSVTVSISTTSGSFDNNKVQLWAAITTSTSAPNWSSPPASANKSVSGSSSQQSTSFYLHGRAGVSAGATPNVTRSLGGTISASCTN